MSTSPVAPVEPEVEPAPPSPKKINVKLIWAGGAGVLLIAVLAAWVNFTSASTTPPKSTPLADTNKEANKGAKPAVTAPEETNPVPAQAFHDAPAAASWIPVYPGTTTEITSSAQTPESDQNISTFKTTASPPKVILYFQDQLKSSGFNIKAASSGEDNGNLLAEDGARKRSLVLNVNAAAGGAGSDARLVTTEKK